MFFSEDLLTRKKGTLGIIWLAATLGPRTRRVTRRDLDKIDLSRTCELIAEPPEPMALRLSGCLLVGVARVYHQNYDIFCSDVNQFHAALRRSIATDFGATAGGTHATDGVDMVGEGKARAAQITFMGVDAGRQSGFDLQFEGMDWHNPFGKRKRRASSKLDSLPSRNFTSESEEEDSDDQDLPMRREKRSKIGKDTTLRTSSVLYHSDNGGDALYQGLDFSGEEQIDLGLFDNVGDTSLSAPAGRGFEAMMDAGLGSLDNGQDMQDFPVNAPLDPAEGLDGAEPHTPPRISDGRALKSAMKKRKKRDDSEGSVDEAGEDLAHGATKKKAKRERTVKFDESLELAEDENATQSNHAFMEDHRRTALEKDQAKEANAQASAMVDGAGGWIEFYNPEMQIFFATLTKVETFKWELDIAVQRKGLAPIPVRDDQMEPPGALEIADPFANGDFGYGQQDLYGEMEDVGFPVARHGSENMEVEAMRRASQQSQQVSMPWQHTAFGSRESDGGHGVESSFSAGSLRLSIMTPQELRIRLSSRHGSSSGPMNSIGAGLRRSRSWSGSVLGRYNQEEPRMLIEGDDLELPADTYAFDITESQAEKRPDIPDAFKPEMLASLETQCRDFLCFIEQKLLVSERKGRHLDLEQLAPQSVSKKVAVAAFYNCLTLTTKRLIKVNQPETWGPIYLTLAT